MKFGWIDVIVSKFRPFWVFFVLFHNEFLFFHSKFLTEDAIISFHVDARGVTLNFHILVLLLVESLKQTRALHHRGTALCIPVIFREACESLNAITWSDRNGFLVKITDKVIILFQNSLFPWS
jgi:hypothetical protein